MLVGCTACGRKGLKDRNFVSPGTAPKVSDWTGAGWFVKDLPRKMTKMKGADLAAWKQAASKQCGFARSSKRKPAGFNEKPTGKFCFPRTITPVGR
jgi:hypothetical protein